MFTTPWLRSRRPRTTIAGAPRATFRKRAQHPFEITTLIRPVSSSRLRKVVPPAVAGRPGPDLPTLAAASLVVMPLLAHAKRRTGEQLGSVTVTADSLVDGLQLVELDLLDEAECVAVVPSVKKFALGLGGRWGKGAVVCRTTDTWGPPLMISLGGGSFGLQIGGQAADYVFLVMNPKGIEYLLRSKFTLGADAAVAAGPVGRSGWGLACRAGS